MVAISLQFVTIPDMIISTPVASHTNSCIQSLQSLFESCVQPTCASQSGEQSRISWAYYPKAVKTNEIARSVIITYSFPCNSKICTFLSRLSTKASYTVTKAHTSPRNSTWFTRPFLLVRGWDQGMRLESLYVQPSLLPLPSS